jgi:hypothetical protein
MFKATDPVTFNAIKTKYATLTPQEKDELIDPRFRGLIDRINMHPELATLHCCSGHTQYDHRKYKVKYPIGAYIVILFTPKILSRIVNLHLHLYTERQIMPNAPDRSRVTATNGFHWQLEESNAGVFPMWNTPATRADGVAMYSWASQQFDPHGNKTVDQWSALLNDYLGVAL